MTAVAQPSGTVTLVFTDIEGSTSLLEQLGTDGYRAALGEHRRIVREACARHEGYEVGTEGDSFFYAFATAQAAVSAVSEAMTGLDGGPIKIRVGIHTGEPTRDPPNYLGLDVHRAARIMSAAHGGQVVLSPTTVSLLEPGAVALRDLGVHRLKDLSEPLALCQLTVEGLPHTFPPLRTLYRSNLPVPATPFLGRESELAEIVSRLGDPSTRLLTLVGPGGTGKTRLALQAAVESAERFPDGLAWVPLAPLREPDLVASTIADAVEIKEQPGREPVDVLVERLAGRRLLVLLDNAEHLLPDLAWTVARLHAVAGPVILVTSRERLRVAGEQTYAVPELDAADAVSLFVEACRAAGVQLERTRAVDELCAQLERLPLALELAAARTVVFSPEQLLDRLSQRLDLLKGGRDADPRQQTLRATIDWSYELLSEHEQQLLRSLSVFAGGFTYEAAEQVAGADPDSLQSLLEKSLIRRREADHGVRYWILETIRGYAAERLEAAGEGLETRDRHACWYRELVGRAAPYLTGVTQLSWLDTLTEELDNIRAVLAYLEHDRLGRLELATPLWRLWETRGHIREAQRWLEPPSDLEQMADPELATRSLVVASRIAWKQGDLDRGRALAERARDVACRSEDGRLLGLASENLGIAVGLSDFERGYELLLEGVAEYRAAGTGSASRARSTTSRTRRSSSAWSTPSGRRSRRAFSSGARRATTSASHPSSTHEDTRTCSAGRTTTRGRHCWRRLRSTLSRRPRWHRRHHRRAGSLRQRERRFAASGRPVGCRRRVTGALRVRCAANGATSARLGATERRGSPGGDRVCGGLEEGRSLTVDEIIEVAAAPDAQT